VYLVSLMRFRICISTSGKKEKKFKSMPLLGNVRISPLGIIHEQDLVDKCICVV